MAVTIQLLAAAIEGDLARQLVDPGQSMLMGSR